MMCGHHLESVALELKGLKSHTAFRGIVRLEDQLLLWQQRFCDVHRGGVCYLNVLATKGSETVPSTARAGQPHRGAALLDKVSLSAASVAALCMAQSFQLLFW